jgi:hypothetical protein
MSRNHGPCTTFSFYFPEFKIGTTVHVVGRPDLRGTVVRHGGGYDGTVHLIEGPTFPPDTWYDYQQLIPVTDPTE